MRRRAFARSVVVTFSIGELACAPATEEPQLPGNPPRPIAEEEQSPRTPPDAKDASAHGDGATPGDADGSESAGEQPPPPPDREIGPPKVTVDVRPDGTCWEITSIDCPPMVACNPPPPRQVECPETALPDATVSANVRKREDGSCWETFHAKCPPRTKCNPPPPMQVKCPPGVKTE